MEFASVLFIELFLPVVLIVYYLLGFVKAERIRMTLRNSFLLFASLLFYAFGGIRELFIFTAIIAINFIAGFVMGKIRPEKKGARRAVFLTSLLLDIVTLIVFKYTATVVNFVDVVRKGSGVKDALEGLLRFDGSGFFSLAVPLAISFFIFQAISYISDVYYNKIKPTKNFLTFSLYMTLLCQLTQGPIMRFGNLGGQIENRDHSLDQFVYGMKRFVYGLAKKVLIANVAAEQVKIIFATSVDRVKDTPTLFVNVSEMGAPIAWLGLILFTIQIYYDFSGYTDMAIGVGSMLGFKIDENFNYPYTSLSVQEFWRRWHISLSSWFKDYVYIPLGGSRCSKARACLNVGIVFLLTGVWHASAGLFTFVIWGLIFVVASIVERLFLGNLLKKNPVKPLNWIYTMLVVMIGWVFFRAENLDYAGKFIGQLFCFHGSVAERPHYVLDYLSVKVVLALVLGILLSGFLQRLLTRPHEKIANKLPFRIVELVFIIFVFAVCMIEVVGGSFASSIYLKF